MKMKRTISFLLTLSLLVSMISMASMPVMAVEFTITNASLNALSALQEGNSEYISFFGAGMDVVTRVEMMEIDTENNILSANLIDTDQINIANGGTQLDLQFRMPMGQNLSATKRYTFVFFNDADVQIGTKPIDVVEATYCLEPNSLPIGRHHFWVSVYIAGNNNLFTTQAITLNSTDGNNTELATGHLVNINGDIFADLTMSGGELVTVPSVLDAQYTIDTTTININAKPKYLNDQVHAAAASVLKDDYQAFVNSGSGDTYNFKLYGYGLTIDLNTLYKVEIRDRNHAQEDPEIVYTVKDEAGLGSGCTIDVTPGSGSEFDVANIQVPKTALPAGHDLYFRVYNTQNSSRDFGNYNTNMIGSDVFSAWKIYPIALSPLKAGDQYFFDFLGNKLDTVVSAGLFVKGTQDNLMDTTFNIDSNPEHYSFDFRVNADLNPSLDYEVILIDGEGAEIRQDIDVATLTYDIRLDGLRVGQKNFYIDLWMNGENQENILDKTFNFYSDAARLQQIGTGKADNSLGTWFVKVNMDTAIAADSEVYYELVKDLEEDIQPRNSDFKMYPSANHQLMGTNFTAFSQSLQDPDYYNFEFYEYGVTVTENIIDTFEKVEIRDCNDGTIVDLATINDAIISTRTITSTDEDVEKRCQIEVLSISIPKTNMTLQLEHDYEFKFIEKNMAGSSSYGTFHVSDGKLKIIDLRPFTLYEATENQRVYFDFSGSNFDPSVSIGLYQTGIPDAPNLIKIEWMNGDDRNRRGEFSILPGVTLAKGNTYEFRVTKGSESFPQNVEIKDVVYDISRQVPVGENEFYTNVFLQGQDNLLSGKTVQYFDNTNTLIGEGTIVKQSGQYLVHVQMNGETVVPQSTEGFYYDLVEETVNTGSFNSDHKIWATSPMLVLNDTKAFYDSVHGTGLTYDFKYLGYGLLENLSNMSHIYITKDGQPDPVIDVKNQGDAGITVSVERVGLMDEMTIHVLKSSNLIDPSNKYFVDFRDIYGNGLGAPETQFFNVENYDPKALPELTTDREFDVNLWGSMLDQVTSVGLFIKGQTDNLIEPVANTLDQRGDSYHQKYVIKAAVELSTESEYELKIFNNTGTGTISKEVKVGTLTYNIPWDSLLIGRSKFLMNLNLDGPDAERNNFMNNNRNVDFYDQNHQKVGTGVVTDAYGFWGVKVDINVPIEESDRLTYEIAIAPEEQFFAANDNNLGDTTMNMFTWDHSIFELSLGTSSETYDFQFLELGLDPDLSQFTSAGIYENGQKVLELKDLLNSPDMTITPANGEYFDTLTIKVAKDQLQNNHNYNFIFKTADGHDYYFDWFSTGTDLVIEDIKPIGLHELRAGDTIFTEIWGKNLDKITSVELYRVGDPGKTNLLESKPMWVEDNKSYGREWYNLKTSLSTNEHYIWRINSADGPIERALEVGKASYSISSNSLPIGKNEFYMMFNGDGAGVDRDILAGNTVNFYSDEERQQLIDTGTVESWGGSFFVSIKLPNNQQVTNETKVYYEVISGGEDIVAKEANFKLDAFDSRVVDISWQDFDNMLKDDASDNYTFKFFQYGLDEDATYYNSILFVDADSDTSILDIKDASQGISLVVGTEGLFGTLTFSIPKSKLPGGKRYRIEFVDTYGNKDYENTIDLPYREAIVTNIYPDALAGMSNEESFYASFEGWRFDLLSDIRLIAIGDDTYTNLASIQEDTVDENNEHFSAQFKLKPGVTISQDSQYEWVFVKLDNQIIERPIDVVDLIYEIPGDNVSANEAHFYLNIYLTGKSHEAMRGRTVDFYSDEAKLNKIGSGTIVTGPMNDEWMIDVELDNALNEGDTIFYTVSEPSNIEVVAASNHQLTARDLVITSFNDYKFRRSLSTSSNSYTIELMGYGLSDEQDLIAAVQLIDLNDGNKVIDITYNNVLSATITEEVGYQILTLVIPKAAGILKENGNYDLRFKDWQGREIYGPNLNTKPIIFTIDYFSLIGLTEMRLGDQEYLDIWGEDLEDIVDIKLVKVGTETNNLIDKLFMNQSSNHIGMGFRIKEGEALSANNTYKWIILRPNNITVEYPVAVAKTTFGISGDSLKVGKTDFYIPMYINGDSANYMGKTVTLSSDQAGLNVVGSGIIEWNEDAQDFYIHMHMLDVVQENSQFYYKVDPAIHPVRREAFNQLKATNNPINTATNNGFIQSLGTGNVYEFVFFGEYLSEDLSQFANITLHENKDGYPVLLDIKEAKSIGDVTVSITHLPSGMDKLSIKITKSAITLGTGKSYDMFFETSTNQRSFSYEVMALQGYQANDIPLDKLGIYPRLRLFAEGIYGTEGLVIEMYEKGQEEAAINNLIKPITDVKLAFYYGGTDVNAGFELKDSVTLSPTKQYVLKVLYNGQTSIIDINVVELFTPDYNKDGAITAQDITIMTSRHNLTTDDPDYHPLIDYNEDGVIDLFDYVLVSKQIELQ